MEKLKPMVLYHLPFATLEETRYRVITMYLFVQFFLYKKGKQTDWDLNNLNKIYEDISVVNENIKHRLSSLHVEDAVLNAIISLDCFARFVNLSAADIVKGIEPIYNSYIK
jgi:hypothetical protein